MGRARRKNSSQKKKDKLPSTSSLRSHQVSGASVNVGDETKGASDCHHVAASRSAGGKELAIYDESFAKRQILQHSSTCAVCQKKGYFMKTCDKCWTSRCCRGNCLTAHRKEFYQKEMCARHAAFNGARARISFKLKQSLLGDGYIEITSHLYSVPRSEIHAVIGVPRRAIILYIKELDLESAGIFKALVQDWSPAQNRNRKISIESHSSI